MNRREFEKYKRLFNQMVQVWPEWERYFASMDVEIGERNEKANIFMQLLNQYQDFNDIPNYLIAHDSISSQSFSKVFNTVEAVLKAYGVDTEDVISEEELNNDAVVVATDKAFFSRISGTLHPKTWRDSDEYGHMYEQLRVAEQFFNGLEDNILLYDEEHYIQVLDSLNTAVDAYLTHKVNKGTKENAVEKVNTAFAIKEYIAERKEAINRKALGDVERPNDLNDIAIANLVPNNEMIIAEALGVQAQPEVKEQAKARAYLALAKYAKTVRSNEVNVEKEAANYISRAERNLGKITNKGNLYAQVDVLKTEYEQRAEFQRQEDALKQNQEDLKREQQQYNTIVDVLANELAEKYKLDAKQIKEHIMTGPVLRNMLDEFDDEFDDSYNKLSLMANEAPKTLLASYELQMLGIDMSNVNDELHNVMRNNQQPEVNLNVINEQPVNEPKQNEYEGETLPNAPTIYTGDSIEPLEYEQDLEALKQEGTVTGEEVYKLSARYIENVKRCRSYLTSERDKNVDREMRYFVSYLQYSLFLDELNNTKWNDLGDFGRNKFVKMLETEANLMKEDGGIGGASLQYYVAKYPLETPTKQYTGVELTDIYKSYKDRVVNTSQAKAEKAEEERIIKAKEEAERLAKEEAERKEAERKAEEERKEAERKAEEERKEAERKAEEERKEAERKAEEQRKADEEGRLKLEAARDEVENLRKEAEKTKREWDEASAKEKYLEENMEDFDAYNDALEESNRLADAYGEVTKKLKEAEHRYEEVFKEVDKDARELNEAQKEVEATNKVKNEWYKKVQDTQNRVEKYLDEEGEEGKNYLEELEKLNSHKAAFSEADKKNTEARDKLAAVVKKQQLAKLPKEEAERILQEEVARKQEEEARIVEASKERVIAANSVKVREKSLREQREDAYAVKWSKVLEIEDSIARHNFYEMFKIEPDEQLGELPRLFRDTEAYKDAENDLNNRVEVARRKIAEEAEAGEVTLESFSNYLAERILLEELYLDGHLADTQDIREEAKKRDQKQSLERAEEIRKEEGFINLVGHIGFKESDYVYKERLAEVFDDVKLGNRYYDVLSNIYPRLKHAYEEMKTTTERNEALASEYAKGVVKNKEAVDFAAKCENSNEKYYKDVSFSKDNTLNKPISLAKYLYTRRLIKEIKRTDWIKEGLKGRIKFMEIKDKLSQSSFEIAKKNPELKLLVEKYSNGPFNQEKLDSIYAEYIELMESNLEKDEIQEVEVQNPNAGKYKLPNIGGYYISERDQAINLAEEISNGNVDNYADKLADYVTHYSFSKIFEKLRDQEYSEETDAKYYRTVQESSSKYVLEKLRNSKEFNELLSKYPADRQYSEEDMKHIGDEFVASYDISKSNAKVCEDSEDYKSCVDWYKMLMDEGNDVVLKHIKDNSLEALKPEEAFAGYMIGFGAKNEISLLAKKPYNEESMKVFDKWYKIRTNINKEFDRMMSSDAFEAGMNSYYKTDNPTYVTLNGMVKKFNEVLVQQAANKEVEHGNQKNFNASADKNKEVAIKP